MLISDVYQIPIGVSLGVVTSLIGASIALSLVTSRRLAKSPSGLGDGRRSDAGERP